MLQDTLEKMLFEKTLKKEKGTFSMIAYYMNLPSRPDRREFMEAQLSMIGLSFRRFEAVRPTEAGGFINCAARGNFFGHVDMIASSMREKEDVLILEDDAEVEDVDLFRQVSLPVVPWHVFYYHHGPGRLYDIKDTHAYVVNKSFAPVLLDLLAARIGEIEIYRPKDTLTYIDQFFATLQNTYIFMGYPVIRQRSGFGSDTGWGRDGTPVIKE
jgi:hypothetical protein